MLESILFLLLLAAPPTLFGWYVMLRRKWPMEKLVPYYVAYGGGAGLFMGWALTLRAWELVGAALVGALVALVSTVSWARTVRIMIRTSNGKDTK